MALGVKKKKRKPNIVLIVLLIFLVIIGGLAFWKVTTVPEKRSYPEKSYFVFTKELKRGRVDEFNLKCIDEEEDSVLAIIIVKLKNGEIFTTKRVNFTKISSVEFFGQLKEGKVKNIIVGYSSPDHGRIIIYKTIDEEEFLVIDFPYRLLNSDDFLTAIYEHQVDYWELGYLGEGGTFMEKWGFMILFVIAFFVFFIYLIHLRRKSKREEEERREAQKRIRALKVTFRDVAGIDEIRQEVEEEILYPIKHRIKYTKAGTKIIRGILFSGPPGCGKTLLATAIAGEAKVPFKIISGPDLSPRMYIGTGVERVEEVFREVEKAVLESDAPAFILIIDELDAIGTRTGETSGAQEQAKTINKLLFEIDRLFNKTDKVFIIATTNRPDIIDPAMIRPGRFDFQIVFPYPDLKGRYEILKVHCRDKILDESVDLKKVASFTPLGFTGADLANIAEHAGRRAVRRAIKSGEETEKITMEDFIYAIDKVLLGPERKGIVMSEEDKWRTAFHEAGHTVVALMAGADRPQKISIIPTTKGAGGYTKMVPEEDRYYWTKRQFLAKITTLYGGRIAELLIYGPSGISQGARQDFEQATKIAEQMVLQYGMADKLGPRIFGELRGSPHLGQILTRKPMSQETEAQVDREIADIITKCYQQARNILRENEKLFRVFAKILKAKEVLEEDEIERIMSLHENQKLWRILVRILDRTESLDPTVIDNILHIGELEEILGPEESLPIPENYDEWLWRAVKEKKRKHLKKLLTSPVKVLKKLSGRDNEQDKNNKEAT